MEQESAVDPISPGYHASIGSSPSAKKKKDRSQKVIISIIVVGVVLLLGVIVVSTIISFLRKEISVPTLSVKVPDEFWTTSSVICDPYGITSGDYRLNFYAPNAGLPYTILIKQQEVILATIVVPQESSASTVTYSYILTAPGTYLLEAWFNGEKTGQCTFIYPNSCPVTVPLPPP